MNILPDDIRARLLSLDLVGFTAAPAQTETDRATVEANTAKTAQAKCGIGKIGITKPGFARAG